MLAPTDNSLTERAANNRIIILFGKKRQGKTTWIRNYLEREKPKRVLGFTDFRNDYAEHIRHTINLFQQFQELTLKGIWRSEQFSVRLKFRSLSHYNYAASVLQHVRHYLLLLDEIDVYCSASYMPSHLQSLLLGSGNNSIDIIAAAKRPRRTPRLLTSQADEFVIFHTREMRDVEFIDEWVGEPPPEPYKSLKPGEYFHFNGTDWKKGVLKNPWFSPVLKTGATLQTGREISTKPDEREKEVLTI